MIYYTSEARKSHKANIRRLIQVVGEIPGDKLSYTDASEITKYLNELCHQIELEEKQR